MENLSPFFKLSEFSCKCGCGQLPGPSIMEKALAIRKLLDRPMTITSGFRCQAHNAAIKGAANSAHCSGQAVDFTVKGQTSEETVKLLLQHADKLGVWFEDPAFTKTWVHITNRAPAAWAPEKPRTFKP